MKKKKYTLVLIAIVSLISSPCYAEWAINFGIQYSETAESVQQTQDGGFIVAGGYGYLITKFNSDGTVNWQKEYTLGPFDRAKSIKQTQDGGYIVAGTSSLNYNYDKIWILKLNAEGTAEWQKKTYFEGNPYHRARAYSVKETFDQTGNPNGYIVSGSTIHLTGGSWDIWVLKLNLDGTINWQKTYNLHTDGAYSIEQTFDQAGNPNGYIVAGSTGYFGGDVWLLRLDTDGNTIWEKIYGGSSYNAYSIQQTRDGGFIVAGSGAADGLAPGRHFWVAKLDSSGFFQWQKVYGGLDSGDVAFSVEEVLDSSDNPNGYVVAGETSNFGAGQKDVWVLKLDLDGNIGWEKTYGGSINESANSIQQTFDQAGNPNGYVVAGYTWSFGTGRDAFVLKLNANGEIPNCNLMGASEAIVSEGSWYFYDDPPTASVLDSEATVLDTNILPNEPDYPASVICFWGPDTEEIIGTWDDGTYYLYRDGSSWSRARLGNKPDGESPSGDIEADDITGDGKADVASCWNNGLRYQNGSNLVYRNVYGDPPHRVTVGDITGDGRAEIVGTWSSGVWFRNEAASSWTRLTSWVTTGDISAGDITGDGRADVASCWPGYGLYYQNGSTLGWYRITTYIPYNVAVGDMTGDGRAEVIGAFASGIWYWNPSTGGWRRLTGSAYVTDGDIACGDFNGDGYADLASCWSSGLWIVDGKTGAWTKAYDTAPYRVTAGDATGD